ncbi:S-methyl-5'-thioinosine phosphorylase [Peptococcaceae bacterium CEB3]|nr:S-methyl-5'-thioinosine phosphorylase [Peptococcaceae bacterium CEB3]
MLPRIDLGIIAGSSTNAISFPEDLKEPGVQVKAEKLVIPTPFGDSPEFVHFSYAGKEILACRMHGWREGVSRADASRQIFWVFYKTGVRYVLTEGGVGAVNHLLNPRDIVLPDDYLDFSQRKDVSLGLPYLLTMRQPICPDLAQTLYTSIRENTPRGYVFRRGVYACTDGRHFESPAEVRMLKQLGADVVGQSLCPEVYLAREIGAHYASIQLVVNFAEGIVEDWKHDELADIFYNEAEWAGRTLLRAVTGIPAEFSCACLDLRQQTMLRDHKE